MKLTERKIAKLTADHGSKDRLVFDDEQRGLAVRVTESGGRTYLCQYTLNGHKWRVPLGACSAVALAKARQAAAAVMGDVARGRNPAADRKAAAAAERARRARNRLTLRVLLDDWNRLHLAGKRPSYAAEAIRALRYAFADHLDDAAEDLDRTVVVRALDCLTRRRKRNDGDGKTTAGAAMTGRTAAYGRAAFAWAVKRGAVQTNPFADLPAAKGSDERKRVLTNAEIAEVWHAAGGATLPFRAIIRLLILTGQRRGEVAGMTWGELSDDLATWTIGGERTKNGELHVVPLSDPVRDLLMASLPDNAKEANRFLKERRASNALVLPGAVGTPFAGWSKAKRALDKAILDARIGADAGTASKSIQLLPWTVHDLRRKLCLLRRSLVEVPLTTLMFQCPKTKRLVSTSIDIDLADIDKLPNRVTFSQCPYCRTVHGWTPKDTFVSEGMQVRRPNQ